MTVKFYPSEVHYAASRFLNKREAVPFLLPFSGKEITIYPPDIALLLAYNLAPNILTRIALEQCKEIQSPTEEEAQDADTAPVMERIKEALKEIAPLTAGEYDDLPPGDVSILNALTCGLLEYPNSYFFEEYAKNVLESQVAFYQTPPSTWGTFAEYRGKIFLYDLDMAASIYLRKFQNEDKTNFYDFFAKGFSIGVKARGF